MDLLQTLMLFLHAALPLYRRCCSLWIFA